MTTDELTQTNDLSKMEGIDIGTSTPYQGGATTFTQQPPAYQQPSAYPQAAVSSAIGQSQQPIIVQIQKPPTPRKENYNSKLSRNLAIAHLTLGAVSMVLNTIGISISATSHFYSSNPLGYGYAYQDTDAYYTGAGIWIPLIFFSLSGAFALCSAHSKARCKIIATMVLSIVASVFAVAMLGYALWAFGTDIHRISQGFYYFGHLGREDAPGAARSAWGSMTVSTLWVLVSLAEIILCIWISTLGCRVTCCDNTTDAESHQYRYTANTGSAVPQLVVLDPKGRTISQTQVASQPGSGLAHP